MLTLCLFVEWQEEVSFDWLAGPALFFTSLPRSALQSQPTPGGGLSPGTNRGLSTTNAWFPVPETQVVLTRVGLG